MKALVYLVLLVAAVFVWVRTFKRNQGGLDRRIDLVAYTLIVVGLAVLFVTCVAEIVNGGPLVQV